MSEELDDEVVENGNAKSLEAQLAEASGESAKRKRQLYALKKELETLRAEKDALTAKLEKKPDALRAELEETKGKLRTVLHKSAFEKVAKSLGANESALDDLFAVSGYKAESDEVDEDAIKSTVESVLTNKPYFKAMGQETTAKPVEDPLTAALSAGLGLSRGATTAASAGFTIRESEVGAVLANPTRRDEFIKAQQDKTLKILPG